MGIEKGVCRLLLTACGLPLDLRARPAAPPLRRGRSNERRNLDYDTNYDYEHRSSVLSGPEHEHEVGPETCDPAEDRKKNLSGLSALCG